MTIKNAVITNATITIEDHGLLTAWLTLDYGGSGQGFGGYCLFGSNPANLKFNAAGLFIWRVLEVVRVGSWDKLAGKTIRVDSEHSGVTAIGHIVKDVWFNPTKEFKEAKAMDVAK